MREKELLKMEKRVDKQKEKLVGRERALVEAEEKHRGLPPLPTTTIQNDPDTQHATRCSGGHLGGRAGDQVGGDEAGRALGQRRLR